tara:strand:+ start:996 stop:1526 length:531 start_codon:yes stop_codon:yes gene_type:complete
MARVEERAAATFKSTVEIEGALTTGTDVLGTHLSKVAIVDNTTAFVRNADSIVPWTQPANTIIRAISILFPSSVYSTGTGNSLGFEVGTTSGGGEIVLKADDQIIDVGTDGTDLATGAYVQCTLVVPTEDGVTLAINTAFAAAARTVYLNTVESGNAAAIVTPGTARWVIEYVTVA